MEPSPVPSLGISLADGDLLVRLSHVHAQLRRHEQTQVALNAELRKRRVAAAELETVREAEQRGLDAPRSDQAPDRVTLEILEAAVKRASEAHEAARLRLVRVGEASAPLIDHASAALLSLERKVATLRQALSSMALRSYEALVRVGRLPFVASLVGDTCGECQLEAAKRACREHLGELEPV